MPPSFGSIDNFYPRPPRGGRRKPVSMGQDDYQFLSTPSARRATISAHEYEVYCQFLSTPSARRATLRPAPQPAYRSHFYPRPPRGGRPKDNEAAIAAIKFLSTPSARRATAAIGFTSQKILISIHALREEGDSKNGEKHLRFCFIIKRSAQIWKSLSKNIRKNSCDLHRTA